MFAAKYTSAGDLAWVNGSGGSGTDGANALAMDGTGHTVLTGYFSGSAVFGGTTLNSNGSYDTFIQRLNP